MTYTRTTRRSFLAGFAPAALAQRAERRPNFVVIVADDLGYGDLSCYGGTLARTPHLDRLAAEGVRFTDFHSNGAVCSPTRAALVTGRYQQRSGITGVVTAAKHRDVGLPESEVTFAELLQNAGYRTALFGKWHLGYHPRFGPLRHGFDEFCGFVAGNVDYVSHVDEAGHEDWWHGGQIRPETGYTTDLITKHGVDFLTRHRGKPFCMYLAHAAVHYPFQAPGDPALRAPKGPHEPRQVPAEHLKTYARMLEALDDSVGQVVAALRRSGLDRDTLVFFCSDNGGRIPEFNGPLRGAKGALWEGGHRVPGIAWWPGRIAPGRISGELSMTADLFPTMLEAAGIRSHRATDGTSLLAHLTRGVPLEPRDLFWAHAAQRAMRRGRWKLMQTAPDAKPALFDLENDLLETRDLSTLEPARVREMLASLGSWEREVSAPRIT